MHPRRYYHVSIGVAPKRAALAAASEELQVAKGKLADAETQLAEVMKKIHDLETSYNNAVTKKQESYNPCSLKTPIRIIWTQKLQRSHYNLEN